MRLLLWFDRIIKQLLTPRHADHAESGGVAITYELIHDTRHSDRDVHVRPAAAARAEDPDIGDARNHWGGTTLVLSGGLRDSGQLVEAISRSTRYTEPVNATARVASSADG